MIDHQTLRSQNDFAGQTNHRPRLRRLAHSLLPAWMGPALLIPGLLVSALLVPAFRPASAQQPGTMALTPASNPAVAAAAPVRPASAMLTDDPSAAVSGNPSAALPDDPSVALPDDPSVALIASSDSDRPLSTGDDPQTRAERRAQRRAERSASTHMKYIPPGWATVHPLRARDKVLLGLKDLYNPLNFGAMFLSAGYEQLLNGQPNYGVDRGAFGERLGAAAIRESTQGIFTDSVFAPLLHEDPRYYIEGPQYSFVHRTLYAITRPLLTRADSGRTSINGAMLLGYAASSALSYTYYPQINKNFHDTAATFGGAIGGAALGFAVTEFASDVLQKLHLARPH